MNNREFSQKDSVFKKACELANTPATSRQASKFRNHIGLAYDKRKEAIRLTKEEIKEEA